MTRRTQSPILSVSAFPTKNLPCWGAVKCWGGEFGLEGLFCRAILAVGVELKHVLHPLAH